MRFELKALSAALLILAGCGGSSGGGGGISVEALMPFEDAAIGTIWTFRVTKVKKSTGSDPVEWTEDRSFKLGMIEDPTGPDIYTVSESSDDGEEFGSNQYGIRRTDESLEMMFGNFIIVTADGGEFGEFDIDMVMPGMRVASNSMVKGDTFTNTLANLVTDYSLTWVGTDEIDGHPNAQRFDFSIDIPHPSNTITVTGTVHVVQDIGPVRIVAVKTTDFGGASEVETYTATLEDTKLPG